METGGGPVERLERLEMLEILLLLLMKISIIERYSNPLCGTQRYVSEENR